MSFNDIHENKILTKISEFSLLEIGSGAACVCLFVLFDLILYVPPTIFQLYRDGSSWVEPVLS